MKKPEKVTKRSKSDCYLVTPKPRAVRLHATITATITVILITYLTIERKNILDSDWIAIGIFAATLPFAASAFMCCKECEDHTKANDAVMRVMGTVTGGSVIGFLSGFLVMMIHFSFYFSIIFASSSVMATLWYGHFSNQMDKINEMKDMEER